MLIMGFLLTLIIIIVIVVVLIFIFKPELFSEAVSYIRNVTNTTTSNTSTTEGTKQVPKGSVANLIDKLSVTFY
jgi:cell shape-determining protein MreC